MRNLILIAAPLALAATTALAGPAERKAEEMCTGQATSDDYPRWSVVTDRCGEGADICTIERNDGVTASYQCPASVSDDDDSGGGSGAHPIQQY